MVVNEYFFLSEKVSPKTAFAYTDNQDIVAHELIPLVKSTLELPFDLRLKSVLRKKNKLEVCSDLTEMKYLWLDYQPNNLAWPLMSGKMRMIIEDNLTGNEGITWVNVKVKCEKEQRDYFILKFTKELNVIDEKMTTYVPGTSHIIKPVFSAIKLSKLIWFIDLNFSGK